MSQGDLKALGHPQQLRQATSESESEKVVRSTAIAIDVFRYFEENENAKNISSVTVARVF